MFATLQNSFNRARSISTLPALRRGLQLIPFAPLDVNCLRCLEYSGVPAARPLPIDIVVRNATRGDIESIARHHETPNVLVDRLGSGDSCAVALVNGKIAGYEWFCAGDSYTEERYNYKVTIPSDAIYGYDAFVFPQYRRSGIWTKLQTLYLRDLMLRLKRQRILVMVEHGNLGSMEAHSQFGYQPCALVFIAKLFGKSLFFKQPLTTHTPATAAPVACR